jgi:hypothetical protein
MDQAVIEQVRAITERPGFWKWAAGGPHTITVGDATIVADGDTVTIFDGGKVARISRPGTGRLDAFDNFLGSILR